MTLKTYAILRQLEGDGALLTHVVQGKDIPIAVAERSFAPLLEPMEHTEAALLESDYREYLSQTTNISLKQGRDGRQEVSGEVNDNALLAIEQVHGVTGETAVNDFLSKQVRALTGRKATPIATILEELKEIPLPDVRPMDVRPVEKTDPIANKQVEPAKQAAAQTEALQMPLSPITEPVDLAEQVTLPKDLSLSPMEAKSEPDVEALVQSLEERIKQLEEQMDQQTVRISQTVDFARDLVEERMDLETDLDLETDQETSQETATEPFEQPVASDMEQTFELPFETAENFEAEESVETAESIEASEATTTEQETSLTHAEVIQLLYQSLVSDIKKLGLDASLGLQV